MASLVENTQRIVNGLNDAYDIVQNRAGSCSRKAENLASEIDSIPSGGGDVESGNFNTVSNDGSFIECGFVPTKISVNTFYLGTASTESCDYFEGDFNEIYRTSGGVTFTMANNRIFPGTENGKMGFRYKARFAGKVAHFIATK